MVICHAKVGDARASWRRGFDYLRWKKKKKGEVGGYDLWLMCQSDIVGGFGNEEGLVHWKWWNLATFISMPSVAFSYWKAEN